MQNVAHALINKRRNRKFATAFVNALDSSVTKIGILIMSNGCPPTFKKEALKYCIETRSKYFITMCQKQKRIITKKWTRMNLKIVLDMYIHIVD